MGMGFPFGSQRRSAYQTVAGCRAPAPRPVPGDPVPARFRIERTFSRGAWTAAVIVWPDAANYEGRKVAVYKTSLKELVEARVLDPHFQEERGPLVPVARFEPTSRGWKLAVSLVEELGDDQ